MARNQNETAVTKALGRFAISIPEYSSLMGIHPVTGYRLAERGELETVKVGTRRLVPHRVYAGLVGTGAEAE